MNETPKNFDWVKARSECSIVAVFKQLELEAEADMERRNNLNRKETSRFKYSHGTNKNPSFYVRRDNGDSLLFMLDPNPARINVTGNDGKIFLTATLTLNNDGECKLKVGDKELEHWQFLRLALEDFFFG